MASKQLLNLVSDHFADLASMTKDHMREMQSTPVGTDPRTPQQEAALWRKLRQLPVHHFNAVLDAAAQKTGHTNDEQQPCDVCTFVLRHAAREGKRMGKD